MCRVLVLQGENHSEVWVHNTVITLNRPTLKLGLDGVFHVSFFSQLKFPLKSRIWGVSTVPFEISHFPTELTVMDVINWEHGNKMHGCCLLFHPPPQGEILTGLNLSSG